MDSTRDYHGETWQQAWQQEFFHFQAKEGAGWWKTLTSPGERCISNLTEQEAIKATVSLASRWKERTRPKLGDLHKEILRIRSVTLKACAFCYEGYLSVPLIVDEEGKRIAFSPDDSWYRTAIPCNCARGKQVFNAYTHDWRPADKEDLGEEIHDFFDMLEEIEKDPETEWAMLWHKPIRENTKERRSR